MADKDDWDEKDDWGQPAQPTAGPAHKLRSKYGKDYVPNVRPGGVSLDTAYKMAGPVLVGMAIGYFLDGQFQTRPWCMLGMTMFGLVTGIWSMLKPLYFPAEGDKDQTKDQSKDQNPDASSAKKH